MTCEQIVDFEAKFLKKQKPSFRVGDTLRVHTKIIEGEKERVQVFTGIVIAMKGTGLSETFSIYRIAYGCAMERVFLLHSPRITKIEIERRGKVKRAKLYYLRGMTGKKAKVKEQILNKSARLKKLKVEQPTVQEEVETPKVEKKPKKKKEDPQEDK